jgi:hypothetical protein
MFHYVQHDKTTINSQLRLFNNYFMKTKLIIFCAFLLFSIFAHAGGPWATGKGKAYTQLGASFNQYDAIFYNGGKLSIVHPVRDNTYQFYGEFGINDKLTLISNVPFKSLQTCSSMYTVLLPPYSGKLNCFGNISLAGKYSFWEKGVNLAAQVEVQSRNNRTDYTTGLRTGYSCWAVTPSFIIGKGFKKWYAFADVGFALRSSGYSEEIISNAEIGYTPFKRFWLALAFNNKNTLKNGSVDEKTVTATSLYVNNQFYNAFGLKVSYGFTDKIGVNLSANGAFAGNFVGAAPTFNASVYYKFLGKTKA